MKLAFQMARTLGKFNSCLCPTVSELLDVIRMYRALNGDLDEIHRYCRCKPLDYKAVESAFARGIIPDEDIEFFAYVRELPTRESDISIKLCQKMTFIDTMAIRLTESSLLAHREYLSNVQEVFINEADASCIGILLTLPKVDTVTIVENNLDDFDFCMEVLSRKTNLRKLTIPSAVRTLTQSNLKVVRNNSDLEIKIKN